MSTQQPSSTSPDEMDIQDVFSLFQRTWYRFLAVIFKGFDFLFKFWWLVALLIIGGIVLGYFSDNSSGYKARLVLKTNYESQSYVYNAVIQFNENLSEGDVPFMQSVGLNPAEPEISTVEIEPVIDVLGLMDKIETSDRVLETVIEELEVEDDAEIFGTNRFYRNYKYHILTVELSSEEGTKAIDALLKYINDSEYAKKLAVEGEKNFREQIAHNERTIAQIDKVADAYGASTELATGDLDKLSFYNNASNIDLRELFEYKGQLTEETKQLKNEVVEVGEVGVIVSEPEIWKDSSLLDKKYIIYPIFFVFMFCFLAAVRFTYITLRRKVKEADLLD